MRRALAALLAALVFVLPVLADGEVSSPPGPEEFVPEIMEGAGLGEGGFAVAFRSLDGGGDWYYNEEAYFKAASVYKLPLNMYFYELENSGALSPDELIGGIRLSVCHRESLEHSDNPISQAMLDYLGGYAQYKRLILPYTGYEESELGPEYYNENAFTARMVLNILDYLYARSDEFSEAIDHLLAAQPGQYLKGGSLDAPIAQKYGYERYDGVLHVAAAGIVYGEHPFLIVILTRGSYAAVDAMGELCDAFAAWNEAEAEARLAAERERAEAEAAAEREARLAAAREAVMDAVRAALEIAPLPVDLPWDRIIDAVCESSG